MPPRNLLIIALTIVVSLACYSVASKNRYANLFAEAIEVIDRQSLRQVPRERLFVSAMEGMLKDLDEHSMFISGDLFTIFDEDIRQEFGGVGMYVEMDPESKQMVILAPMPGTPAYEVGCWPGDQIVSIDGTKTFGKTRLDAIKLLRGPIGKNVVLEIDRGGEALTKTLKRAAIPIASVHGDSRLPNGKWDFKLREHSGIAYVRLLQFGERSAEELKEALKVLGPDLDGLIIDLRNNSGGLLDIAIEICDMFLPPDKLIVSTRGRNEALNKETFSTTALSLNPQVPIVILVNRNSASASEILSGCLQDHGRAILIGEQSWGKGTVQNVIPIQRGESALKLTTSSYWRPSGKHIDRYDQISKETKVWGVQPDSGFEIEQTDQDVFNNMRARSLRDLRGLVNEEQAEFINKIRSSVAMPTDPKAEKTPADQAPSEETPEADVAPKTIKPHVDKALQRAIEYFRSLEEKTAIAA